tara:strand:- start:3522 stop:5285 length:1764 start_codon:yes stop_codon:yes gene_type:complete
MLNVSKKNLFSFIGIFYFIIYILFANFIVNTNSTDIDYKNFTSSDSCKYTINQINFYDFEEADKSYQIYKHHVNFIRNPESLKCINKIELIQDGWPVIRVEISGDSLFFQVIKNSGLIILFIFYLNFYANRKKLFLFSITAFNLLTYTLFSVDFISQEFKFLYSYEIIIVEILITYLIFLRHTNNEFLKKTIHSIQDFILNITNKNIFILSTLVGIRAVYIFFNYSYANNISEWLIHYNFGFIRRGLIGSFLLAITDNLNFIAYTLIPIILFFLHFSVIYISLKIFQENNKNIYSLFLLFSPLYILFPIFNVSKGVGNKELLGILCFLLVLRSSYKELNQRYYFLIISLFTISILSHEVNLFVIAFLIVAYLVKKINFEIKIILTLLIISIIFIGTYFLVPASPELINSLCNETYLNIENLDCTKAYYLEQNSSDSINSSINRVFEDSNYLLVYGIYFILGLLPFTFSGWITKNNKLFILILFAIIPLFFIAIDWGRWLHILIFSLSAIYFMSNSEQMKKDLNISNSILLILYSTLWRVPQCCVEEINLVYLFRFNKFNYLIYIFLIYTFVSRKKESINKINEFIKF